MFNVKGYFFRPILYSHILANLLRNPRLAPNPNATPAISRLPKYRANEHTI